MNRPPFRRLLLCTLPALAGSLLATLFLSGSALAREAKPRLVLEAAEVTPAKAPGDALCQLRARIENSGESVAAGFVFAVKVGGREIPVYRNHVFMEPIEPGDTRSLHLYGFWTSETGRPLPASGDLDVEVTLQEARWMKVEKDAAGARVWHDLGAVEGLPQTARQTVAIAR